MKGHTMDKKTIGVYQLDNGFWAYRYTLMIDNKRKDVKRTADENGKPFKTEKAAMKAREKAIVMEKLNLNKPKITRITVQQLYEEYCEKGRNEKAYTTIVKQDSLWNNHFKERFGNRFLDEISVAEVNDYLAELYYVDGYAYKYVESFLKMFYLIFGQAYSRNYLSLDNYNKLCICKDIKIHMPKLKVDDDIDIVVFGQEELTILDSYFKGTNAETAYLLGRYCGLRINECYGLKWADIDFDKSTISVVRQMQYQEGIIKLVPLKTRNAKRIMYMNEKLSAHLLSVKQLHEEYEKIYFVQRQQKQTMVIDVDGTFVSSLELVNTLPDGKIQTINSMKYHSRKIKSEYNIIFKYHYLRHTYGTRLAELNTPTHLLCRQMGHSSSKVTERYYLGMTITGINVLTKNLNTI